MPPSLRREFLDILRGLEAVRPLAGETSVQATVRKMSAEDAELFASRVVVLFGEVARASTPRAARAEEPRAERHENDSHNRAPLLFAGEA